MAYVLVVDNHGKEVARFHHSELEGLGVAIAQAIDQERMYVADEEAGHLPNG